MKGPCLCGDPYCPNCGGQYDTSHIIDFLDYIIREVHPAPEGIDRDWLSCYLYEVLGSFQSLADAVDQLASEAAKNPPDRYQL